MGVSTSQFKSAKCRATTTEDRKIAPPLRPMLDRRRRIDVHTVDGVHAADDANLACEARLQNVPRFNSVPTRMNNALSQRVNAIIAAFGLRWRLRNK